LNQIGLKEVNEIMSDQQQQKPTDTKTGMDKRKIGRFLQADFSTRNQLIPIDPRWHFSDLLRFVGYAAGSTALVVLIGFMLRGILRAHPILVPVTTVTLIFMMGGVIALIQWVEDRRNIVRFQRLSGQIREKEKAS
jgi:hypothetical protein